MHKELPLSNPGDDGQVKVQVDEEVTFHTTLSWLRVDRLGRCTQTKVQKRSQFRQHPHNKKEASTDAVLQEEKGAVVARLRVPFRDLRILDPLVRVLAKTFSASS